MAATNGTVADRLRQAIADTPGMSARRLSRLIAERNQNVAAESARRSISKWLAGEPIGPGNARLLAEIFGKPDGYFMAPRAGRRVAELEQQVESLTGRLQQLEAEVSEVQRNQLAGVAAVSERLALLEAAVLNGARRADRGSSHRRS